MGRLDGKVAIVTGAGAGLGRSHALALAAAGATVIVNNRVSRAGRPSAELVAEEIGDLGGRALVDTASVADWTAMGALVERAVHECGRLDIVVNNAGILVWDMIADIDETAYDELMAVNVKGTFALTHHACVHWRAAAERGEHVSGRIINTVSGIGLFGFARGGGVRRVEGRGVVAHERHCDGDAPLRRDRERDLAGGAGGHQQGDLP